MLLELFETRFPDTVSCLKHARCTGRLGHAYLVHADTAELRRDFALFLAQLAACPSAGDNGTPCGVCRVCTQLGKSIYPELYFLQPTGKMWLIQVGERKNPEPNTVRWFENMFHFTSISEAGKKIGIIHDADRMNTQAQNAFLKTLEEPPADTLLILTTGCPSSLLPTTRSRCQPLVLIENRCHYDFPGAAELFAALFSMQFSERNSLMKANESAILLLTLSDNLKNIAENTVTELWEKRMKEASDLLPAAQKRLEAQYTAATAGEYLRLRQYFTDALYVWFAQIYQLSSGAPLSAIANPDIFHGLQLPDKLNEKQAFADLQATEKLLFDLKFNISEELAIRAFCANLAVRN